MAENKHTLSDLYQMQSLPLSAKIRMTEYRIKQWIEAYGEDGVYVSFSGGKDSTVLLDIIWNRLGYKEIPAVFVNVPTQYPELREFAEEFTEGNLIVLDPQMSFMEVCKTYGFPLISKEISDCVSMAQRGYKSGIDKLNGVDKNGNPSDFRKGFMKWKFLVDANFAISDECCFVNKKEPVKKYEHETKRKPFLATMASESVLRRTSWVKTGCNSFESDRPISMPMAFWTEQDVLLYAKLYDVPLCSVYGEIVEDSEGIEGQISFEQLSSEFGVFDNERPLLKTTGCDRTGCVLCGFGCYLHNDDRFVRLKQTHPGLYNLLDVIENNGVTYRQAIDWINEHGNLNIKY